MALKCNLSESEVKELKSKFNGWLELEDEKKALSDSEKDLKKDAAEIIEGKVKDINLLFKSMRDMYNGSENDLDEVGGVLEAIRANGNSGEDSDGE